MNNSRAFQHVAVTRTDKDHVSVVSIITVALEPSFDPESANAAGYVLIDGAWYRDATDEVIERELSRTVVSGWIGTDTPPVFLSGVATSWRRIGEADIPTDRTFRNAWVDAGDGVVVDLPLARNIVREKIRQVRPERFQSLDNAMKPLEVKAALGTITAAEKRALTGLEAQRQALRDAPADPAIDAAKTVDDLKAHLGALVI